MGHSRQANKHARTPAKKPTHLTRRRAIIQISLGLAGAAAIAAAALGLGLMGHADATPPETETGLLSRPPATNVTGDPTIPKCPATPPDDSAPTQQTYYGPATSTTWAMIDDTVQINQACVACAPYDSDGNPTWIPYDFPELPLVTWRITPSGGSSTQVQRPLTQAVSEGHPYSLTSYQTSQLNASDDRLAIYQTPAPTWDYVSEWDGGPWPMDLKCQSTTRMVRVFNPQATLTKQACLPGKACDPAVETDWTTDLESLKFQFGQTVTWRILVTNTGNVDIANMKIESDQLSSSEFTDDKWNTPTDVAGPCEGQAVTNLAGASPASTLKASGGGQASAGYATCQTTLPPDPVGDEPITGFVTNEAQAIGNPADPSGGSISSRFDGPMEYRTNAADVTVQVDYPHITLKKYVCVAADEQGDCTDWQDADTNTDPDLNDLPEIDADSKAAKPSQWKITVTNDGSVDLTGLTLKNDKLTHGNDDAVSLCSDEEFPNDGKLPHTAPDNEASIICTGPDVTDPFHPLINMAQATANYGDTPVDSNENDAQIIAKKKPSLAVKKYVCVAADATKCDDPPTDLTKIDPAIWADTGAEPGSDDTTNTDRAWISPDPGTAKWLIVAENTGNMPLKPVKIKTDSFDGNLPASDNCTNGSVIPSSGKDGLLWPKPSDADPDKDVKLYYAAMTCSSEGITATNPVVNTVNEVQLEAVATDEDGVTDESVTVEPSNVDVARAAVGNPALALKKYACKNPTDKSGVGCEPPASITGTADEQKAALEALGWMDTDTEGDHVIVQDGKPVEWLIVAQNTGTVALANVKVSEDSVASGVDQSTATLTGCVGQKLDLLEENATQLMPGKFAVTTCKTDAVAATIPASEVVNTAKASGQPANPDTGELLGWPDVPSNTDVARAQANKPALQLTKWVCAAGKVCAPSDFVSASDPGDWVKKTEIAAGTDATWLIAVTNTGTVDLRNVTLASDTLTAAGKAARDSDGTTCVSDTAPITLKVNESKPLTTCTSTGVKLAESPLVNTAKASATSDDDFGTPVTSNTDTAQVTVPKPTPIDEPTPVDEPLPGTGGPAVKILKQVCKWGTGCNVKTDSDWVAETTQPDGKIATWRIIVANVGSEPLIDIKVTDTLSGTRSGSEALCELASDAGDVLKPGYQVAYLCASASVARSESGLVNSASVTAKGQTTGKAVSTPVSSAKVLVEPAPLPLTGLTSLGIAGLAVLLIGGGAIGLLLRRRRTTQPRHAAA